MSRPPPCANVNSKAGVLANSTNADLGAAVDLGLLAMNIARRCLSEAGRVSASSDVVPVSDNSPGLLDALNLARARILRLSVLADGCGSQRLTDADEVEQCSHLERHVTQLLQTGEHMVRLRFNTSETLATRQHDVPAVVQLLGGGSLRGLGWPVMTESLMASLGRPHVVWPLQAKVSQQTQERLRVEMFSRLAESSCLERQELRQIHAEVRHDGIRFRVSCAFQFHVVYDLKRWQVLEATILAGCGHGVNVCQEDEDFIRRHLQDVADSEHVDGDVLAAICDAANVFCSRLWLRILHNEALNLSAQRPTPPPSVRRRPAPAAWRRMVF